VLEEYLAIFSAHGITDVGYLTEQYRRYCETKRRFEATWRQPGRRLLDVGAHWLHQSVLYARDGYQVTAADLLITFREPSVQSVAAAFGIKLIEYPSLENPAQPFRGVPDNAFDIVLFTEIIEHLTFNPVAMWKELYRMLAPGGRIIITTPNYYSVDGRWWNVKRAMRRMGGGITVDEILSYPTYGHHWKEFSLSELRRYFDLLSLDLVVSKAIYVDDAAPKDLRMFRRLFRLLAKPLPILRPNLHLEVDLPRKVTGITGD
jgi:2-polyprenyl-6-hydroxyphenyl methylase/3-demethylubiquinone-9 3-methyltransferase